MSYISGISIFRNRRLWISFPPCILRFHPSVEHFVLTMPLILALSERTLSFFISSILSFKRNKTFEMCQHPQWGGFVYCGKTVDWWSRSNRYCRFVLNRCRLWEKWLFGKGWYLIRSFYKLIIWNQLI